MTVKRDNIRVGQVYTHSANSSIMMLVLSTDMYEYRTRDASAAIRPVSSNAAPDIRRGLLVLTSPAMRVDPETNVDTYMPRPMRAAALKSAAEYITVSRKVETNPVTVRHAVSGRKARGSQFTDLDGNTFNVVVTAVSEFGQEYRSEVFLPRLEESITDFYDREVRAEPRYRLRNGRTPVVRFTEEELAERKAWQEKWQQLTDHGIASGLLDSPYDGGVNLEPCEPKMKSRPFEFTETEAEHEGRIVAEVARRADLHIHRVQNELVRE